MSSTTIESRGVTGVLNKFEFRVSRMFRATPTARLVDNATTSAGITTMQVNSEGHAGQSLLPSFGELQELAALQPNWNDEDEDAPTARAVAAAFYLIEAVGERQPFHRGRPPEGAAPMPNGGIELFWKGLRAKVFAHAEPDGSYSYVRSRVVDGSQHYDARSNLRVESVLAVICEVLES